MSDIIELAGVCALCTEPIQPGESVVTVSETGEEVHSECYAQSQEQQQRNNSYT